MNQISFKFKSFTKNITVARNMVALVILDKNPTLSFINELKTVISEAVTNAIVHGYNKEEDHEVLVEIADNENYIEVVVTDNGIGIENLELAQQPMFTTKANEERSGLGFTIMKMFSDAFEIKSEKDKGTKIKIRKNYI